ncbi:MAG: N-acetyltransferase family protein [Thermoleophilaceae bacterium]
MHEIEIRAARADEVETVRDMYEWLFAPPGSQPASWDPDRARAALAEAVAADGSTVLVADAGGELVGFITAYLDLNSVRFGRRCWVEDLAVDPTERSRRIGKRLLEAAQAWARERGASHLELDTALARTNAQRFYEREGPSGKSYSYSWEL